MSSYAVTGASRGLGFEFVNQLSANPSNHVFGLVRDPKNAKKLQELAASKKNVHVVKAEITDPKSLKAAAAAVAKVTGGSLGILINNAGLVEEEVFLLSPTDFEGKEADLERVVDQSIKTNVLGVIYAVNAFLPLIRAGKTKKIINLSTGMADEEVILTTEISQAVPYSLSKAALNTVNAKYAVQLKPEGVVVSAISPGWVDTSTTEPTEGDKQAYNWMLGQFRKMAPELPGQLTAKDSVKMQLDTIEKLTIEDSGKFISHHGPNTQWF